MTKLVLSTDFDPNAKNIDLGPVRPQEFERLHVSFRSETVELTLFDDGRRVFIEVTSREVPDSLVVFRKSVGEKIYALKHIGGARFQVEDLDPIEIARACREVKNPPYSGSVSLR